MSLLSEDLETIKDATDTLRAKLDMASDPIGDVTDAVVVPEGSIDIDANGTYDVTDYEEAVVDISVIEGAYKVDTIAERDALTNLEEGDICVVSSESTEDWTADTVSNTIIFPETISQANLVSEYISIAGATIQGEIELSTSSFYVYGYGSTCSFEARYSKSGSGIFAKDWVRDRLTGTDTVTGESLVNGNTLTLPEPIGVMEYDKEDFLPIMGKFMQTPVASFSGIYEYHNSSWRYLTVEGENKINALDVFRNKKVYTDNGTITGTFGTSVDNNSFKGRYKEICDAISTYKAPQSLERAFEGYKGTDISILKIIDLSDTTNMNYMLSGCSNLTSFPDIDLSHVTDMRNLFYNCSSLTEVPNIDTSNVKLMTFLFAGCSSLTRVPLLDLSNVTLVNMGGLSSAFSDCTSLTELPPLDTSHIPSFRYTFSGCTSLVVGPNLDTSSGIEMMGMFSGCTNLTTVPVYNLSSATSLTNMFSNCTKLTDQSLDNILQMCIGAVSYEGEKTLAKLGIKDSTLKSRIPGLAHYQAFLNAGWTIG